MYIRKGRGETPTQKQQAYDYYNSFEGKKVTWCTFYQRVRTGDGIDRETKIKPKERKPYTNSRTENPTGRWAEELRWYNNQPVPKASKSLFRNRLNGGYPKEQAITIGDEWLAYRDARKRANPQVSKKYTPKFQIVEEIKQDENYADYHSITITYKPEEARAIAREYQKMIDETEEALLEADEKLLQLELNTKLENLEAELKLFLTYNK